MNITILDGYTLNPGDLTWDELNTLGNVTIYDRTAPHEVISRCKEADIVLTNKVVIDKNTIDSLPQLQYIGVLATGYNVVDIAYAKEKNIVVTNIPAYSTPSVVQLVFAYILHFANSVSDHDRSVHNGEWLSAEDFSYTVAPLWELAQKTLGIIGYGKIGSAVAQSALAFGMNVVVHSRRQLENLPDGIKQVTKEELFTQSDIITLHCPLTEETNHIVNKSTLALMKKEAYLINTGRGPLVHENDLAETLNNNRIAGAALDVLSTEPPQKSNPLLTAKNCIITPHIGWATKEARSRLLSIACNNIKAYSNDTPTNVINA